MENISTNNMYEHVKSIKIVVINIEKRMEDHVEAVYLIN